MRACGCLNIGCVCLCTGMWGKGSIWEFEPSHSNQNKRRRRTGKEVGDLQLSSKIRVASHKLFHFIHHFLFLELSRGVKEMKKGLQGNFSPKK